MEASVIAGWSDFLVAAAGVAGALAGLVFVAISINLTRIITMPDVSGRASETLIVLGGTLAGTLVALIPHLSAAQLGGGLLLTTVPTWALPTLIQLRSITQRTYYRGWQAAGRVLLHQLATLPGIATCLGLCGVLQVDFTWFAATVIASLLLSMFNAWILLVEILR